MLYALFVGNPIGGFVNLVIVILSIAALVGRALQDIVGMLSSIFKVVKITIMFKITILQIIYLNLSL